MARDLPEAKWLDGSSRWCLRVQRNRKRRAFYSPLRGPKGRRECEDKARRWLEGLDDAGAGRRLVSDVYAVWLEEVRANTSETAHALYSKIGRLYILPEIGGLRMEQLTNEQLFQNVINCAFRKGNGGKGLSRKSLSNIRGAISTFLKFCRKSGLTTLRPENLEIPRKAGKGAKTILQPGDLRTLFVSSSTSGRKGGDRPEWYIHAFRFHVLTGLRPGELIGLRWTDIEGATVHIRRSIDVKGNTTPCKNANARRSFILPRRALDELAAQKEMLKEAGVSSQHVFPDPKGAPAKQITYASHLCRYCAHNGMTVVSPYELRHTWYSINKELPAELVKAMGGHSESMDTFGVYGHEVDGDRERTASLMDDVMARLLT